MFEKYIVIDRIINGGNQKVFRFPNGFGASVVDSKMLHIYPFYKELAVLEFSNDNNENYNLTYDTPITDDVELPGDEAELNNMLENIKKLKKR